MLWAEKQRSHTNKAELFSKAENGDNSRARQATATSPFSALKKISLGGVWPLFSKRNSKVSNSDTEGVKAARQAIAAGSCNWVVFCRGVSCSSSHGSYSPLVFSHFDKRPLNQSVKTLPALGCQACKLASHLGHGVVAALSDLNRSCQRWLCW